jgi:signal transduction histidine kinase
LIARGYQQTSARRLRHGKDKTQSLGLGRVIVGEIIRAHQGTIEVQSQGAETTFTVSLPSAPSYSGKGPVESG